MRKVLYLGSCVLALSGLSVAQANPDRPNGLDTSFGNNGFVLEDFGSSDHWFHPTPEAARVQVDGKIVVAGTFDSGSNSHFFLLRYLQDGTRDWAFGNQGLATYFQFEPNDGPEYRDLLTQPDGKIILLGSGVWYSYLLRLLPNGQPDETFGTHGLARFGSQQASIQQTDSLALQSDGKILFSKATSVEHHDYQVQVYRLNTDGSLDTQFGENGRTILPGQWSLDTALTIQADGKILLASTYSTPKSKFAIARLDETGKLDDEFGNAGIALTQVAGYANQITVAPDGKLIVAGSCDNTEDAELTTHGCMARFDENGSVDKTFGKAGLVLASVEGRSNPYGASLKIATDGEIFLSQSLWPIDATNGKQNYSYFTIMRFSPNGSKDITYGHNGAIVHKVHGFDWQAASADLQNDGSIIATGMDPTEAGTAPAWRFATIRVCPNGNCQ